VDASIDRPPATAIDEPRLDAAFELVARQVTSGRVRVAGLAVGRAGGLIRCATYGPSGTATEDHRFLVASITKPITATAVLQLVEDGRLVLTQPVQSYLPEFAPPPAAPGMPGGEAVTAWHLLTHTSGVGDVGEAFLEVSRPSAEFLYRRCCTEPLRHAPGSRYAYATDSFFVLARLVRCVGDLDYGEHLRRRIFEPLGMTATTFDPAQPGPPPFPLGGTFDRFGRLLDAATRYVVSLEMPGGGLWSTPGDLMTFGRAMLSGGALDGVRVLARPLVELMTDDHTQGVLADGDPPEDPHYGLGWSRPGREPGSPASARSFGHRGGTGSQLIVDPEHDLVVVYLRNEWGVDASATDEAIRAVYGALA
jgi:CubicO group peptidase (beta-lactamase class C family)